MSIGFVHGFERSLTCVLFFLMGHALWDGRSPDRGSSARHYRDATSFSLPLPRLSARGPFLRSGAADSLPST